LRVTAENRRIGDFVGFGLSAVSPGVRCRGMASLGVVVGESAAVVAVREQVGRLLRSGGAGRRLPPILVLGETGTGKGLLAATIHRCGSRAAAPFVDVNCSAIPETLLESELFGFERGAFTDARQAKPGLFQAANGGTIFLDEVGLLPLAMQAKLLKVIEERSVRRLGSTRSEPLDVSVIAATSEDLPAAVATGRFRADLYHRLAVVTLTLPPLRDRDRDVLLLAEHFLAAVCEEYGVPPRVLGDDAQAALIAYRWPGNVRELANVLERAVLLSDEPRLTAAQLGLPTHAPAPAGDPASGADVPESDEREGLVEALEATGWNFTRAAARLGVPRNTLRYRAERLGLSSPPERRRGGRPPGRPAVTPAPAVVERRRLTFLEGRLICSEWAPADWQLRRALDASVEKVRAFGGRVDETTVDGLVAVFGLERDEEAPRRAAHAAIAIAKLAARALREDPHVPRVTLALHTAAATVSGAGDRVEIDAAACQDARRELQAVLAGAAPGTIVASAGAARFLERRFELARLAPAAWQIVRTAQPGRSRFVGREHELSVLTERVELAHAGRGQVVILVGEPGVGKSRLLHELRRQLGATVTWIEGQALSFGRAMAFHPVVDMLKRVFRIDDGDPDAVIVAKIERATGRLGADLTPMLPFLRYLLSVDPGDPAVLTMDPKLRHARIMRATQLLLERGSELRTHVVVLEDAHWADPATEDWLARLADVIAARRALVLVTARPGYRAPLAHASAHTALALPTLSTADTLRIAGDLLGVAELPPALEALVADKADGNPFFVEELVRSLQELGIVRQEGDRVVLRAALDRVAVPDTVEEIILARMDRLDRDARQLLRIAAVIGRTVPLPVLRAVAGWPAERLDAALHALQAADFLDESRAFPELEYTFKHALTQDVAHASLARDDQRALHAAAVDAIERVYAGRPGEHVERLAYHALRGERWTMAVRFFREAGAKAFDRCANREAVASLEQALVALERLPAERETLEAAIDIRLVLRSALLQLGEIGRMTRYVREAEAFATTAEDRPRLAWVWTFMSICHLFVGAPAQAAEVGERAFALAEEVGDLGLRATARTPWAHACRELGDYRRALELVRGTIDALGGDLVRQRLGQGMPPGLYARNVAALCLAELGDFPEAIALGTESMTLAESLDVPFGAVLARIALGHTYLLQGDLDRAATVLDAALELIATRDTPAWFPWAAAERGYAMALAGHAGAGVALLERAVDRAVALPFLFGHSQWVTWLAHAHLLGGRVSEAARLGEEALALSRKRGERGYEAWALHTLGVIAGAGGHATADPLHRQALALARELHMRPLIARCEAALRARPNG
jgi:transcriptional regulator with AAA-type ATPase domain/tetratricopeptide (TPR) repeat protein